MVYLDYAATAVPHYRVSDFNDNWFNPNSHYAVDECLGFYQCEKAVKEAIGAKSGKVIFGGNATWFFNELYDYQGDSWFCGPYEHDCVYRSGIPIYFSEIEELYDQIYCHQLVNNITGEIFPVQKIGEKIKSIYGYFVCDATAAIGRCSVPDGIEEWCDALVLSSHKLGVDNKQIGCTWVSDRFGKWLELDWTVVNGYGLIKGTPDYASAKATAFAVSESCAKLKEKAQHYYKLSAYLEEQLLTNSISHSYVKGFHSCTNAIGSLVLHGVDAEALCQYLASVHQVYISAGYSACEKNSNYRVLRAYGLTVKECKSTIRVSFGEGTTEEDIDALVNGIVEFCKKYGG